LKSIKMSSPVNDLELEYEQENSDKENNPILTSKSAISKKKCRKIFHELQISENLKKQAEELTVGYRFENWEHVDQVLYAYAKTKGFVWRLQNTYYRVDKNISKKVF